MTKTVGTHELQTEFEAEVNGFIFVAEHVNNGELESEVRRFGNWMRVFSISQGYYFCIFVEPNHNTKPKQKGWGNNTYKIPTTDPGVLGTSHVGHSASQLKRYKEPA